jgi:6-phosphogluconolactonase (cycloisomerase 2 family)
VVICANYSGGSAASFLRRTASSSEAVWTEHYTGYPGPGPVADRQEGPRPLRLCLARQPLRLHQRPRRDKIHIYKLNQRDRQAHPRRHLHAKPGDGPAHPALPPQRQSRLLRQRAQLHRHRPAWHAPDGSLTPIQNVALLPEGTATKHGDITNTGCDAVLTRDGRFAYFANRGDDFLMSFHIDPATGKLTAVRKGIPAPVAAARPRATSRLDPTERWMLVANQGSSNLSVFARDPKTGAALRRGQKLPRRDPHVHRFRINSIHRANKWRKRFSLWIFPMLTRILATEPALCPLFRQRKADPEASMVVDLKKLSEALGRSSPEEDLRRDLQRILAPASRRLTRPSPAAKSYVLRVPDGRRIRISRRAQPAEATR